MYNLGLRKGWHKEGHPYLVEQQELDWYWQQYHQIFLLDLRLLRQSIPGSE